jgi:hypothetical protein
MRLKTNRLPYDRPTSGHSRAHRHKERAIMPDEVTPGRVAAIAAAARVPLEQTSAVRVANAVNPTVTRFTAQKIALPLEVEPATYAVVARQGTIASGTGTGLADPTKAVPLDADPLGNGERPISRRIKHVELAVGCSGVVGLLEGPAGLGHGAGVGVEAVGGDEHPLLRLSRHAGKCGDDEREKKCGLGHG